MFFHISTRQRANAGREYMSVQHKPSLPNPCHPLARLLQAPARMPGGTTWYPAGSIPAASQGARSCLPTRWSGRACKCFFSANPGRMPGGLHCRWFESSRVPCGARSSVDRACSVSPIPGRPGRRPESRLQAEALPSFSEAAHGRTSRRPVRREPVAEAPSRFRLKPVLVRMQCRETQEVKIPPKR